MCKNTEDEQNNIDNLTADMFRETRCPQQDALTVFIPDGEEPSPEIQNYLNAVESCRWYPQDGGHLIKFPNIFEKYEENLFQLEKNAWDHEHCDKCGKTINANNKCWVATIDDEYFYLFCDSCYLKL